jgi:hypothetical protein
MVRPKSRPDRILKAEFDKHEEKRQYWPALMGDAQGNIKVTGRPMFVHVRIGSDEVPGQAYNNCLPNRWNLPCIVGYAAEDPTLFQVISERACYIGYPGAEDLAAPRVPNHHETHEWGNGLGGDDTVFVHVRQYRPFRIGKDDSGDFVVRVEGGAHYYAGAFYDLGDQTIDLAADQPAGTQGLYVLIYLAVDGTATARAGTAIASAAMLDLTADCPTTNAGERACAAVRLYGWQTEIDDYNDIIDLREAGTIAQITDLLKQLALVEAEFDFLLSRHVVEG